MGHGSPMLALDDNKLTHTLSRLGQRIVRDYGRPEAILMISAHWYKNRNLVQRTDRPQQIYDMYGFPKALYEVKYPVRGCAALSDAVLGIKEIGAEVDTSTTARGHPSSMSFPRPTSRWCSSLSTVCSHRGSATR